MFASLTAVRVAGSIMFNLSQRETYRRRYSRNFTSRICGTRFRENSRYNDNSNL